MEKSKEKKGEGPALDVIPNDMPIEEVPSELLNTYIEAFARREAELSAGRPMEIEHLPLDPSTQRPEFGRWVPYLMEKYDPESPDTLIKEIYFMPREIEELTGDYSLLYTTPYGNLTLPGWFFWTVIRARSYDAENKRVVPVKQVLLTPRMAIIGVDAAKQLEQLTIQDLQATLKKAESYLSLVMFQDAWNARREAQTYKDALDNAHVSHIESVQNVYAKTKQAEDMGDQAYSKSLREKIDAWGWLRDNWWIILIAILGLWYAWSQGWIGT